MIGTVSFLFSFKYSKEIFEWIEKQTRGTQSFVLEKFEFLFLKVNPDHVTYGLIFLAFGPALVVLSICGLYGNWVLGFILAFVFSFIGFKIPKPVMNFLVNRRIKEFRLQMVDGMTLLANGIRAGLSVPQSIGMVVSELKPPISQEFDLMLSQNRIGVTLEDCFENLVKRIPTEDNEMFVASVNILRETGGNLAEVFDTIVFVIRERVRLQQKVDTYIAQGMIQGLTIVCMPYIIAILYSVSDPGALLPLVTKPMGWVLLGAAVALDTFGGFLMYKIVKIKI